VYDFKGPYHPLPGYAAALARDLVSIIEQAVQSSAQQQQQQQSPAVHDEHNTAKDFSPDAALVCLYRAGDTLCGHRDDVERDLAQVNDRKTIDAGVPKDHI
jgi:hypothetical protein